MFERCREVQNDPDEHLDLWARDHYKSTIITFAKTIQDILASHGDDPLPKYNGRELTFGIFSHTRPIAKGFMRQIKRELEGNEYLKELFPDVLYESPQKDAPKWSEDDGIIVKRKTNPKEATVEAHGLVDGQPTSKHFFVRIYDDVVTRESVTTPDMINKTTDAYRLSTNLGTKDGIARYIGTRYHFNDTYATMIDTKVATLRVHAATENGTKTGKPVFLTQQQLEKKHKEQGDYVFSCQMLLNPKAENTDGFNEDWLEHIGYNDGHGMNKYLLVDPANDKKKKSDFTVMVVIGIGPDGNRYLLDGIRDKLNLTERANCLMRLHRDWQPLKTGYERYGKDSDIHHIKTVQQRENYRFEIIELGGNRSKADRIRDLIPLFEEGRFYIPNYIRQTNYEKRGYDFVQEFKNEYIAFPFMGSGHDDILDCMARIEDNDLNAAAPIPPKSRPRSPVQSDNGYNPHRW